LRVLRKMNLYRCETIIALSGALDRAWPAGRRVPERESLFRD